MNSVGFSVLPAEERCTFIITEIKARSPRLVFVLKRRANLRTAE